MEGRQQATAEQVASLRESVALFDIHKRHAKEQRDAYNRDINDPPKDTLVVCLDFKEKMKLGGGPREEGQSFYTKSPRTLLGITCFCRKGKDTIMKVHEDFVSEVLNTDGLIVRECLVMLAKFFRAGRTRPSPHHTNALG